MATTSPIALTPSPKPAAITPGIIGQPTPVTPIVTQPNATSGSIYQATPATSTTTGVSNRNVGANETVQNQITGIIDQNSSLMQQAKSGALQSANDRGLSDSSIAVGAGQNAVIQAALPIASQDAQTYANTASQNMGARNSGALQDSSNATNKAISAGNNAASISSAGISAAASRYSADTSKAMASMDNDTKVKLANIQADYSTLNQTSSVAANLSNSTMSTLNSIAGDPSLSPEMQKAKYNATIDNYNSAMNLVGSINGINLTDLLSFPKVQ